MNFNELKALIGKADEVIRMEQSLFVGKKRPLDIYTVPLDGFSDLVRTFEESENTFVGMELTVLNERYAGCPPYKVKLVKDGNAEQWRLVEAGIYPSGEAIVGSFSEEMAEGKTYSIYPIVPIGFEFVTRDADSNDGSYPYHRFRCIGYDVDNHKIILENIPFITVNGPDYEP